MISFDKRLAANDDEKRSRKRGKDFFPRGLFSIFIDKIESYYEGQERSWCKYLIQSLRKSPNPRSLRSMQEADNTGETRTLGSSSCSYNATLIEDELARIASAIVLALYYPPP